MTRTRDFMFDAALGKVPGVRRAAGLGVNPDVDTGTIPEDVWDLGGLYPWMASATSLEVVSDSANDDDSGGTGARQVEIRGLRGDLSEITQTVALSGTTPVAVPEDMYRINRVQITAAGSGRTNDGRVDVRDAGGGTVRAAALPGISRARQSVVTAPADHGLLFLSFTHSLLRSPSTSEFATVTTVVRQGGVDRQSVEMDVGNLGGISDINTFPIFVLDEGLDFVFRIITVTANDIEVTSSWFGFLVDKKGTFAGEFM